LPQLNKVAWGRTKRFLDNLGFGWLFESQREIEKITLTDLDVIPLKGGFDFGYALGQYNETKGTHSDKTPVGRLLHRFKYKFDQGAGVILAELATEWINSRSLLKSSDFMVTVPPSFTSRPFDPISFLAERISSGTGIRWQKDVIKRARITGQQKRILDKETKKRNVELTFALHDPMLIKDKKI
jgi:predicted amidophosphoribosyltransferase